MFFQLVLTAFLALSFLNLLLNLVSLKTPRRRAAVPSPAPRVSVLVPARNEAANIGRCLESLSRQDYPDFEILVLDDNSTDDTAAIVNALATSEPRIRLISGQPLPEGWAGKPFACRQLADHAVGDWLLFVDADTVHAPHMLRSVLALAVKHGTALLSGFPRQTGRALPLKIGFPVLYFIIMAWMPLWWLHHSRTPKPSLAIGQFLLFERQAYLGIGGHDAVKSRILEDVWLGIEITRRGGRHLAVNLAPVVSCSMYGNIKDMWEGFLKWFYSVAHFSQAGLIALIVLGYFLFLAPFVWLWQHVFISPVSWSLLLFGQVGAIYLMRLITDLRLRDSLVATVLHPLGLAFVIAAAVVASVRHAVGAAVRWKDREYGKESIVK